MIMPVYDVQCVYVYSIVHLIYIGVMTRHVYVTYTANECIANVNNNNKGRID